ncbi:MAG: ATP-binding cassette domain-containing protein [Clostridia bacterium]|nr:ATP-binding cassette domain-containing protein [Clostridia bacterium]
MEILSAENIGFRYVQSPSWALSDVSFSLSEGEWAVVCGASGSGKSTLLRMLKRELTLPGERVGTVRFRGRDMATLTPEESAFSVGFVAQSPEQQIVTDRVWHELAFGLESRRLPREEIARRIAETASYFGIADWYDRETQSLSGGQKQLLNLAAVMVMRPDILILDEPTSQLDPITATRFIDTLAKLHRDFSLTILMSEHHLEELAPLCDKWLVLSEGKLLTGGRPREVAAALKADDKLLCGMPAAVRLYQALGAAGDCPLTVREGREWLEKTLGAVGSTSEPPAETPAVSGGEEALSFRDVRFRYDREAPDVLRGLDLTVRKGELFCLMGGNGCGKTTALLTGAGLLRPQSGRVCVFGKKIRDYKNQSLYRENIAMLPQDVQTLFLKNTVREELADAGAAEAAKTLPLDFDALADRHPYDLSGGQQQLLALAKALGTHPRLLFLDEPTKGLDAAAKRRISETLRGLTGQGITVVCVTHDTEFVASYADRCALMFGGQVVFEATPDVFFSENYFYTTAVSRMTRGLLPRAVTVEAAAEQVKRLSGRDRA